MNLRMPVMSGLKATWIIKESEKGKTTKIVALTAADCEILYAIGAGDTLVGRGEYCDYPAPVADVPAVQSGAETNIEQIISLRPQVLLMSTMDQTEEQVSQLDTAGISVVVSNAPSAPSRTSLLTSPFVQR